MLEVTAHAKINLTLEVLGRRNDGYHQVRTILQTVDLADRLEIDPSSSLQVECDHPDINGEANLVWAAANALADHCGIVPRARITVKKGIPVSMGLGGGSSDAAAVMIALNEMWELGLGPRDLAGIAAGVGSDVAFFLTGGTALAEGRGELITPLPPLPSIPVTLICPAGTMPQKTAAMYSALNPSHYSDGGVTSRLIQILAGGEFVIESVAGLTHNIFEQVVYQALPEMSGLWNRLRGMFQNPLRLAGSGPAMYCLPSNEREFRIASNALQPYGVGVYLVHTTGPNSASNRQAEAEPGPT
ncbi:MAG: 4-(cytidine 5'-diphospho)-2-C-methyl-D-erythritol kinase [SAR202 cluster bacterium Io17-Chloro-G2]|nr:MAG: 4-(cytidine 5'-diphospho)-2-C-methyl-D-erythritol kinase [SAR202 cluster bacterium Io17-Chloro-G2]